MDLVRAGRALRAIRRHKRWTLERAAREAKLSLSTAWRIEAGRVDSARELTAYARALGADVDLYVRWRAGELDRLLNGRHAAMHECMAQVWPRFGGWDAVPEVTFSVYGERGVVDWVAWHAETGTLLLVELKTQLVDVNDLLATTNRRVRLAPQIAEPYGWRPRQVGTWLVMEEGRTNRRHVANHAAVLRAAFPDDGRAMNSWLRRPTRPIRCLSFLPVSPLQKGRQTSKHQPAIETRSESSQAERLAGFYRPDDVDSVTR
jgi:transcriptional regulator with XRE-family HTH domain